MSCQNIKLIVIHAGHLLAHGNLVRHCADTFLASEHKDIRMEAVRTCSRLLSPSLHVSGKYMLWFDFIFGLIFVKPVYIFQTGSYFSSWVEIF